MPSAILSPVYHWRFLPKLLSHAFLCISHRAPTTSSFCVPKFKSAIAGPTASTPALQSISTSHTMEMETFWKDGWNAQPVGTSPLRISRGPNRHLPDALNPVLAGATTVHFSQRLQIRAVNDTQSTEAWSSLEHRVKSVMQPPTHDAVRDTAAPTEQGSASRCLILITDSSRKT
ncbi:hypothetical protein FB45DRAFT_900482 [Roridomyces roridus]|uniref:Uncharacterized protein n=1 Tax=Roridomyces roridus TaxID=1738132 RepID=A0AAD7FWR0_9AGAR|nr:hypothetical protein FB45DRAFT_900482 [Roridomyces roridus]